MPNPECDLLWSTEVSQASISKSTLIVAGSSSSQVMIGKPWTVRTCPWNVLRSSDRASTRSSALGCIKFSFFANFKKKNTGYASLGFQRRKIFFFFLHHPPIYAGSLKYADFENFHRPSKKYFLIFFFKNVFLYISRTL